MRLAWVHRLRPRWICAAACHHSPEVRRRSELRSGWERMAREWRPRISAHISPAAMTPTIASALLPLLRRIDPERAHGIALHAMRLGFAGSAPGDDDPSLAVAAFGRRFANPIGLAA